MDRATGALEEMTKEQLGESAVLQDSDQVSTSNSTSSSSNSIDNISFDT